MALDGGPMFKFTEAISFFVNCKTQEETGSQTHISSVRRSPSPEIVRTDSGGTYHCKRKTA